MQVYFDSIGEPIVKKKMTRNNSISRNKSLLLLVIKFALLIFISYFIVQLSIGAKEIEEKRDIPGLQTTMEFADQYMKGKYFMDWPDLGSYLESIDWRSSEHMLKLSSDVGTLRVTPLWGEGYQITQIDMKKGNNDVAIWIFYKTDLNIKVTSNYKGNYTKHNIEYQNGSYIPNLQMEQETGFTTDEIVEQADKMRIAFEEEMEKMHQYQIGRAKERRKKFTDFGFIIFLLFFLFYSFIKWVIINRRADIEDKYLEEVLEETIVKEKEKLFKGRYLLSGIGMAFWIYILKTIVSEFMLFSMEGTAKEYAAYGISAVITAIVFGLFWKSLADKKSDRTDTGSNLPKSVLQFLSGSIATLIMVQLAVVFVPRFYSFEWRFYKINLLADGIAFFILIMIAAIIRRTAGTAHDDTKAIEGGVSEDGA